MRLSPSTYKQQSDLADYCRTGELSNDLEVNRKHVRHYRRLVYNVVYDSLQSAFPLTMNLVSDEEWQMLVHTFFSNHKNQASQVWQMPREFYIFWAEKEHDLHERYPFLSDLLHLEWIEIEVFMMEDIRYPETKAEGNLKSSLLAFNPEHRFIHVNYPVHLKNARQIEAADKGEYYILVFREKNSGRVQFMDLSPFYTLILENLIQGLTLEEIFAELEQSANLENSQEMLERTLPFLEIMQGKQFITGYHKR